MYSLLCRESGDGSIVLPLHRLSLYLVAANGLLGLEWISNSLNDPGGVRLQAILATDVGSTTTKAILLEKLSSGWRLSAREEAPTTVEAPYEDVTVGVRQAVARLEKVAGRRILDGDDIVSPPRGGVGVDLYISTSSAGGGLQMVAAGLIRAFSAGSAQRAALGAGAIVSRTLTITDARLAAEAIDLLRRLRPDIILLCGGTDGGNTNGVISLSEYLAVAGPRPRQGVGALPVVFAGNEEVRAEVERLLGERYAVSYVGNVRPSVDSEHLDPARHEVHRVFLEHVMSRAPGYDRLMGWSARQLEPTPHAVSTMMRMFAGSRGRDLLGIDIGGATTDVFTVVDGEFTRSVSANLGLSYSAGNVLQHAGVEAIQRWLPHPTGEEEILDAIYNKMIRPTTLPETLEELALEHAIAREAIRLAMEHHLSYMPRPVRPRAGTGLWGLLPAGRPEPVIAPGAIIGSGGPLCHAPRRAQAALILLDAAATGGGPVELYVDSVFMLPHLGVLATSHPEIAVEVFERDCLVHLGTAFVASLPRWAKPGQQLGHARIVYIDGPGETQLTLRAGELKLVPLPRGRAARVEVFPRRGVDFGRGAGSLQTRRVDGGEVGIIFDLRGRPIRQAPPGLQRRAQLSRWLDSMSAYPPDLWQPQPVVGHAGDAAGLGGGGLGE